MLILDDARRVQSGDGSRHNPFKEKSAAVLERVIGDIGMELRFNVRSRSIEFRDTIKGDTAKWETTTDRVIADLRERISSRFWYKARTQPESSPLRFSREAWSDGVNALSYSLEIDPFLEWLGELPPWDGTPRLEFILSDLFGTEDTDLTRFASRAPFVGAVQRARFPGSKIDETPVFKSEQGYGKSAFIRSTFPSELADQWTGDGLDFRSSQKEMGEALSGRVIIEIAELAGSSAGGNRRGQIVSFPHE